MEWVKREGIELAPAMWEMYLTDPSTAPPSEWRTELFWPVA
jgi:effector-binding domain-containing protein